MDSYTWKEESIQIKEVLMLLSSLNLSRWGAALLILKVSKFVQGFPHLNLMVKENDTGATCSTTDMKKRASRSINDSMPILLSSQMHDKE
jgi:hypothetical protein